jgi:hypothetical protein
MTQADEWVAQARTALEAGNRLAARGYWRLAARAAPDRLDVWLGLCQVSDLPADRVRCLERIVELDPDNEEARADLARLLEEEAAEAMVPEAEVGEADGPLAADSPSDEGTPSSEIEVVNIRADITDEMRRQWDEAISAGEPLVCINHPHRETSLRCNRCGVPICTRCAVRTPVGFRCQECIKAQQSIFFNAQWYDYPLAAFIALLLSIPAAVVSGLAGWWFALIIGPFAGGLIGAALHWAVGRRRGRWIWLAVGVCVVLGAVVVLTNSPFRFLAIGIYAFTATGAAMGVLRLGRLR